MRAVVPLLAFIGLVVASIAIFPYGVAFGAAAGGPLGDVPASGGGLIVQLKLRALPGRAGE